MQRRGRGGGEEGQQMTTTSTQPARRGPSKPPRPIVPCHIITPSSPPICLPNPIPCHVSAAFDPLIASSSNGQRRACQPCLAHTPVDNENASPDHPESDQPRTRSHEYAKTNATTTTTPVHCLFNLPTAWFNL